MRILGRLDPLTLDRTVRVDKRARAFERVTLGYEPRNVRRTRDRSARKVSARSGAALEFRQVRAQPSGFDVHRFRGT